MIDDLENINDTRIGIKLQISVGRVIWANIHDIIMVMLANIQIF